MLLLLFEILFDQENRIKGLQKKILENDKNDIKDPKIASEMAEMSIKQKNKNYHHNKAQKSKAEKKLHQTSFNSHSIKKCSLSIIIHFLLCR